MEGPQSLLRRKIKALKDAIASILNDQDAGINIALVMSKTQAGINDGEQKIECQKQIIIAKHAKRELPVSPLREMGSPRLEDFCRGLADLKYESAVVASPILTLPHEVKLQILLVDN